MINTIIGKQRLGRGKYSWNQGSKTKRETNEDSRLFREAEEAQLTGQTGSLEIEPANSSP